MTFAADESGESESEEAGAAGRRSASTGDDENRGEETASSSLMDAMRDIGPYLDLGWRLAGSAAFPPLLGVGIDLWMDTLPWGLLVGCVLGLSAAVLQLTRLQDDFK